MANRMLKFAALAPFFPRASMDGGPIVRSNGLPKAAPSEAHVHV